MPYELVIANKNYSSWSLRPWVLMRVLGIEFTETFQQTLDIDNFEAYRRHSPSGKLPCLIDRGTKVWDSLAITLYLAERRQGIWPEDPAARAWAFAATAEMHAGFSGSRSGCPFCVSARVELSSMSEALRRDLDRVDELWREGLERFGGPFLAGPAFTAVDAFYVPFAFRIQTYDLPIGSHARAWATTALRLPAVQEWERAAHADPWRELGHEREVLANGRLIVDLRDGTSPVPQGHDGVASL